MSSRVGRTIGLTLGLLYGCTSGDGPPPVHTPAAATVAATPLAATPLAASIDPTAGARALAAYEDDRRATVAWATVPPASQVLGAEPIALAALPGAAERVGLLRGAAALVLLAADGRELARAATGPLPAALAVGDDGAIHVAGAGDRVARFRVDRAPGGPRLIRDGEDVAPGVGGIRALAVGREGARYAADDERGVVSAWTTAGGAPPRTLTCRAPIRLLRTAHQLLVDCLIDHEVRLHPVDDDGLPGAAHATIRHDGPIWALAALEDPGGDVWLALGGVEDHPLDRSDGTFGFVDSFLFLYRVGPGGAERVAAIDLGELGVVVPHWVGLTRDEGGGLIATASGYGGDQMVTLGWPADGRGTPTIARRTVVPGIAALVPGEDGRPALAADPLLDAWLVLPDDGDHRLVHLPPPPGAPARSLESRVGELLAFTHLMAPWATTAGRASRFTCETCHFEGGIDGRVHATGRGAVHAVTRPLFGLFQNRPHFTRALDRSTADMVDNEFRVATRSSGRDPWFALGRRDVPWLAEIEGVPEVLDPVFLRRSLIAFLADLNPEPARATVGRGRLSATERAGAEVFRARCAACHPARLSADRADSALPFERWEAAIFSPTSPIVWARDGYERTGVEPYVHPDGARPSSLRRLARKQPYFTTGTARTIDEVLARAGWKGDRFFHDGAPTGASRLGDEARTALAAFLALL